MKQLTLAIAAFVLTCAATAQGFFTIEIPADATNGINERKAAPTWIGTMDGQTQVADTRHVFEITLKVKSGSGGGDGLPSGAQLVNLDESGTVCWVGIMESEEFDDVGVAWEMTGKGRGLYPIESGMNPETAYFIGCKLTAGPAAG